jgi:hypothetical protein
MLSRDCILVRRERIAMANEDKDTDEDDIDKALPRIRVELLD